MSEFLGKTCPYCKTPFKEGDDVVICSVCEMPHHKECWVENQECTTFGCTGTIQGTSAKNAGMAFCPYCGTPHTVGDSFCGTCGNSLNGTPAPVRPTPVPPAYPTHQTYTPPVQQPLTGPYDAYIQQNTDFYNRKFRDMDTGNSKASWNWAAFLISPFWCIYRKMYVHAAALFIAASLLSGLLGWIGTVLCWAGYAVFGVFANHLYRDYLKKVTDFASHVSEPAKSKYLAARTGADMNKAALISFIACVIAVLLGL
ncbi:MAG: DUF2628 domain-containing protein [Oscillospiraceae bacterium]|nr:DUF2628 domain-containing protein [Oscillospiraceae bacterium]